MTTSRAMFETTTQLNDLTTEHLLTEIETKQKLNLILLIYATSLLLQLPVVHTYVSVVRRY